VVPAAGADEGGITQITPITPITQEGEHDD
jgi:hypothetical protein